MDWKKIKDISVKIGIFGINALLVAGGVYYAKSQDQKKKEVELKEAEAYNEEVAKHEVNSIQEAIVSIKEEATRSIEGNPKTVSKQEVVEVKKYIPPVTKQVTVTETKPSKKTSSS